MSDQRRRDYDEAMAVEARNREVWASVAAVEDDAVTLLGRLSRAILTYQDGDYIHALAAEARTLLARARDPEGE